MAVVNVLIRRSPEQVWDVLSDGSAYADWVVGTRRIRAVDEGWPALGAAIHYTAGVGPLALRGTTTVRHRVELANLGLEADAGLLGAARITIELIDWGGDTLVVLDEHPLRGPAYWLHNPLSDTLLLARGWPMMHKLARLVERRHPGEG
jgi:uncharacterized protein YndB with AHSA1/START domain